MRRAKHLTAPYNWGAGTVSAEEAERRLALLLELPAERLVTLMFHVKPVKLHFQVRVTAIFFSVQFESLHKKEYMYVTRQSLGRLGRDEHQGGPHQPEPQLALPTEEVSEPSVPSEAAEPRS